MCIRDSAILAVLQPLFSSAECSSIFVLEVGSGTGQHAIHFAQALPHLQWQPADRSDNIAGITAWREWAALDNVLPPLLLDVNQPWPLPSAQNIFSANTLHIMSWNEVQKFFTGVGAVLAPGGILCVYGPFNYGGQFTSDSNAQFEQWLKARDSLSGIRDFEAVNSLAQAQGLSLLADNPMPANNRCLVWKKEQ